LVLTLTPSIKVQILITQPILTRIFSFWLKIFFAFKVNFHHFFTILYFMWWKYTKFFLSTALFTNKNPGQNVTGLALLVG